VQGFFGGGGRCGGRSGFLRFRQLGGFARGFGLLAQGFALGARLGVRSLAFLQGRGGGGLLLRAP
jgi:hypothetical protein